MQNQFIVSHNGVEMNPMAAEDVLAQLSRGELDPIDYVYIDDKQDWMMLDEFKLYWETQKGGANAKAEAPPSLTPYPSVSEKSKVLFVEPSPENKAKVAPLLKEEPKVEKKISEVPAVPVVPKVTYTAPAAATPTETVPSVKAATSVQATLHPSSEALTSSTEAPKEFLTPAKQVNNPKSIVVKKGTGTASLSALKTGEIAIELRSKLKLNTSGTLKISIRSGEPGKMTGSGPSKTVVGENAVFEFHIHDDFGNKVSSFADAFPVKWQGEFQGPTTVNFIDGKGQLQFTTTKTQKASFTIQNSSQHPKIALPNSYTVDFIAGPAAQLVLDGPEEAMAGEAIQVRIKALDKYGNLAELDEEVEVEIKAPTAG